MARKPKPTDPVEVIARAMCRHADPDEDHRGKPLWTMHEKDARRIVAALKAAKMLA